MPRHCRGLIVQNDIRNILPVFNRIGNRRHATVKKCRIAHEHELFVVDKRIDTRTRATAESHSRQIVHQPVKWLVFQQGITSDISVKNQIHRICAVLAPHVIAILKIVNHLVQHTGRIAVRAARAKRGCANRRAQVKSFCLSHQGDNSIDALGIYGYGGIAERFQHGGEHIERDARVEATTVGKTASIGKALAPYPKRLCFAGLIQVLKCRGDLFFQKTAFFFHHVNFIDHICKFAQNLRINRIRNPVFQNGNAAPQSDHIERVFQITIGQTAGDKADPLFASVWPV